MSEDQNVVCEAIRVLLISNLVSFLVFCRDLNTINMNVSAHKESRDDR